MIKKCFYTKKGNDLTLVMGGGEGGALIYTIKNILYSINAAARVINLSNFRQNFCDFWTVN